ncbi:methyltransferase type 11 [Chryseobacterium sp. IHB B 17019]|jgi:ubiquinone/menaquinone biosynthesis C-methylase UbiE|uniref:class I SAM-dependent methyltransferase n=1 Tax=Chryseobacterium sp. IHB B 17019 TaxID=1721091 RepID=UPI000720FC0E|nr:class I SAM-dependent methyltransferase [Chryseobacterium sp. IHB B 17019]ALR29481.1 methyltransferase type 11 [Chryseobacterium sp. IHB B 17019]
MRATVSKFLRQSKLLFIADKLRFYIQKFKNQDKNKSFQSKHPEFIFPPDYLMYESFNINYESYYKSGKAAAEKFINIFKKYNSTEQARILDWGCGPARVVRHIPEVLPDSSVFGTDYNQNSIEWNKKNIKNVDFNLNGLSAKLPYEDNFFDFIYGISIFTHLSEQLHYDWKNELTRVLKKDGILLLSLQGNLFKTILTDDEIKVFEKGNIVVRGNVKEGHRTYSAFHPEDFVKKLFSDYEILEHIDSFINNGKPEQDIWILKKK